MLARIVAPAVEPLTLTETKLYLRVDHNDEDAPINDLIVAARMVAESWLKRSLITQTWKLTYDDCLHDETPLPMGPVASITSVVIVNRDNSSQTVNVDEYYLNAAKNKLIIEGSLVGFKIEISYSAGYGSASFVPKPIKQGMLAHIAYMYDERGNGCNASLPDLSGMLYMPFREISL